MTGDANAIVERFRRIMGPVAVTIGQETAKVCGGSVKEEKIVLEESGLGKFKQMMKEKCGKIIGDKVAERILEE